MDTVVTSVERDTIARNRIVSETDKNFFVEAGAGSGKTTMLVSRMVAMVESGIDISKICAITFTKAAAGEFYDRFQKQLIERSNPDYEWEDKGFAGQLPEPTEETRKLCARALENIDLCFMGTIDSFCSMVLSEHPSEAGIPSDANIMSDNDAQSLYKQIYVQICDGKYGDELKELARTFRTLHYNPEEVFVLGEKIFMNNRNVHFNFAEGVRVNVDQLFAAEKATLLNAVDVLVNHPELAYTGNAESRKSWEGFENTAKRFNGRWSNNFSRVLSGLKAMEKLRVIPGALETYGVSLSECFEPGGAKGGWLEFTYTKKDGLLNKLNALRYDVSMTFLSKAVPIIVDVMRDKGAMTFFDYLYYLREMLKEDAAKDGKLIRYIYDRHSYFLIDEFQDTNPMQAEVFFYLASDNPVEQWSACVPRPGSLFIVGDPKQSIYRFRSADVTSFLKVKRLFKENGGDILYLSRNFRSTKNLIGYFNRVFSAMLPEESEVQSKYEEIPVPEEERAEFQGVYTYTAYTGKAAAAHPGMTDPEQIRKVIENLVGREEFKITVGDEAPRPIRYNDIMVISYGKAKIDPIMKALDEADIPMRVEGIVPFGRNAALVLIYLLYRAAADPQDARALYDVLKAPGFGISDEELMKFRLQGGKVSLRGEQKLSEDSAETTKYVAACIEKIKELSEQARKLSPAALFEKIMDDYEVYRIAKAENLEVVYYTLELLRSAERTGLAVTLKAGAAYLYDLIAGTSEVERCLSLNDTKDCVHIANLHKVKGLEAPVIILAAAPAARTGVSHRIVHTDHGSEGYIFSVDKARTKDSNGFSYFETARFPDEMAAENEALKAENKRLVYVAATRARNTLIVCDSIQNGRSGEVHKSLWKPLMENGQPDIFEWTTAATAGAAEETAALNGESAETESAETVATEKAAVEVADVEALYKKAEEESVLLDRTAEEPTYSLENPSHTRISSKLEDDVSEVISVTDESGKAISETESKEVSKAHRFPALLGTMTHRLMEVMISSGGQFKAEKAIDEIVREYRTPKNEPYEKDIAAALKAVAETMAAGGYDQENGAPKDIVAELLSAEECYTEVPFCYKDTIDGADVLWNGVMDVVYKKDGKWHIIDYKTNIDGTKLDQKYKGQLEAYKKAFAQTTGETVEDAMTYHIDV